MHFVKATASGIAGVLIGLILGYALWGHHATSLNGELAKANGELATTKTWLLDEIRWSDERYDQISATLVKAQQALAEARGEFSRASATSKQTVGNVYLDGPRASELDEGSTPASRHARSREAADYPSAGPSTTAR